MVPLFFFVSGWLSQISRKNLWERTAGLVRNLVYPYVLWSIIQCVLMIVTQTGGAVPVWTDLPRILTDGWMQFWFLHCLILIVLIDVLFRRLAVGADLRLVIAVVVTSTCMLGLRYPWRINLVASHILYFEAGVFLARSARSMPRVSTLWTFLAVGLIALLTFNFCGAGYGTNLQQLAAFSGVTACFCLSCLAGLRPNSVVEFCRLCGFYSLQIYVLHTIISAGCRVGLMRAGISHFWLHLAVGSLAGILAPLALAAIDEQRLHIAFRLPPLSKLASAFRPGVCQ